MAFADIDAMTLDEMRAEFVDLGTRLSVIEARRSALRQRMEQLKARASAAARISAMSEAERAALREVLGDTP